MNLINGQQFIKTFSEDFDNFYKILSAKILHFTYFLLWRLYIAKQHYPTTMYIIALNSLVYLKAYGKTTHKKVLQKAPYSSYIIIIECIYLYAYIRIHSFKVHMYISRVWKWESHFGVKSIPIHDPPCGF